MLAKILNVLKWMSVWWLLYQIHSMASGHCPGNQITWVDKNTSFVRCSPCPPCPPGQEFSIPCNSKAVEGTNARCNNCLKGKYSRSFDTKPCVHCKICSKRYVKRNCTLYRNAKCGDCLPGYYRDDRVFDCIKCDKCCLDGKDKAPPGCKKVGMCKPRLHGCPPTPSTRPTSKPTTKRLTGWMVRTANKSKVTSTPKTTTVKDQSSTKKTTFLKISQLTRQNPITPSSSSQDNTSMVQEPVVYGAYDKRVRNDSENDGYKIAVGALICIICILCAVAGCFIYFKNKEKRTDSQRPEFNRSLSRPVVYQPVPTANDRTLKDFMDNGFDTCESVCIHLNKLRNGKYDFERVGMRLGRSSTEMQALVNQAQKPNQNPTKELMENLCSHITNFTVKQFAKVTKDIKRGDVYDMLEPYFEKVEFQIT